jgi:membrane-bound serine protease (ClpP class)
MHAWLAFLAGVLVVVGAVLILAADFGVAYLGLPLQIEVAIAIMLLIVAGIFGWLFYVGVKAQNKLIKTGKEALIGARGVVTTALTPKGEVRVGGEFWQAATKAGSIPVGQDVEVEALDGMFLVVHSIQQKA